ncbi:hypothetical protein BDQ17DRAFT_1213377, partial [Cyathus striatus]
TRIRNTLRQCNESLSTTACATLQPRFTTFGSFQTFPNIGGSFTVLWYGDAECGSCWRLQYHNTSATFTIINQAPGEFDISLTAFKALTGFVEPDIPTYVTVNATEIDREECG